MFYDQVSDIFQELENLSLEQNLIENLKLIAYTCDSSRSEDFSKYFKSIMERLYKLSKSKDLHYSIYILLNITLFLKEAKSYSEELFKNEETLKLMSNFFDLSEKIIKKSKTLYEENMEKQKEILSIIENNFFDEYHYRNKDRLLPKQLNLPF
jgi:hypothetical protein